jgi:hypothetical protein
MTRSRNSRLNRSTYPNLPPPARPPFEAVALVQAGLGRGSEIRSPGGRFSQAVDSASQPLNCATGRRRSP